MPRIRTIPKAVKEIQAKDPDTYITVARLRKWVKEGRIPTVPDNGTFALIDLDQLEKFLSGEDYADS